ncbi:MAG: DUF3857 and transglutaminase domain-containing protein [Candidatus Eisenbacteria bacterium]
MKYGLVVTLVWVLVAGVARASPAPTWFRGLTVPAVVDTVASAEFLLIEHRIRVPVEGRTQETERGALVIRKPEGSRNAQCAVYYDRRSGRVRQLRAWLRYPNGRVQEFDDGDTYDLTMLDDHTLMTDARRKVLVTEDAPVGAVFAWEWATEEDTPTAQWGWMFARGFPVRRSRFELELPEGAEVRATGAPRSVETTHAGNVWSWELKDVAALQPAVLGPAALGRDLVLRLSVRTNRDHLPAGAEFADWNEVGAWSERMSAPQAQADDALRAKALTLTAGREDALAKARALGAFVQGINYVATNVQLGLGFGYRPRPATEVFHAGYGDCKDKANLLRAMLRTVGLESWLVMVYSGDRHRVVAEWPTVRQFNHCILALQDPTPSALPASKPDSELGALVFFDPTDPCTNFGDLPSDLQGSYGMLQTSQAHQLVQLPVASAGARVVRRDLHVTLREDGTIEGEWKQLDRGQPAARAHCLHREGRGWSRQRDERTLSSTLPGVDVRSWAVTDEPESLRFTRNVSFEARGFGHRSGGGLMTFVASVIPSNNLPDLRDTIRSEPFELEPMAYEGVSRIELPDGWSVDELPGPTQAVFDFGQIEASWARDGRAVVQECRWRTEPSRMPASRLADVRRFIEAVRAVDRSPVVLVRD